MQKIYNKIYKILISLPGYFHPELRISSNEVFTSTCLWTRVWIIIDLKSKAIVVLKKNSVENGLYFLVLITFYFLYQPIYTL